MGSFSTFESLYKITDMHICSWIPHLCDASKRLLHGQLCCHLSSSASQEAEDRHTKRRLQGKNGSIVAVLRDAGLGQKMQLKDILR